MPSTSSSTDNSMTRSSSPNIYGVDAVALLATGACVFLAHCKRSFQIANKEPVKEQPVKLPK